MRMPARYYFAKQADCALGRDPFFYWVDIRHDKGAML